MQRLAIISILATAAPALFSQHTAGTRLFISGEDAGYVEPGACSSCHREIYEGYRRTGMGRSFYRPSAENTVEDYERKNTFYHAASEQHFKMYKREGRFLERRHQIGPNGRETNVVEKEIRYVLGSGNHARAYLSLTSSGQLEQTPVGWYAEAGGFWGMNPGYDRADHMDFRRKIDQECFFCHDAYPEVDSGYAAGPRDLFLRGAIPEGIDCQRCHGPGRAHVQSGAAAEIINPARLNRTRQLEICFQCHLESTSKRLPYAIRRYRRGLFSYRPGEPLENYILYFDYPRNAGYQDKFEINSAAYRLLKSACFLKSATLTCTTCHNPHEALRGEMVNQRYRKVCRSCHTTAHNATQDCIACHMPKRRTDDAIHIIMTDHFIQRRSPSRDPLAPTQEAHDSYRGEVAPLYPRSMEQTSEGALYLAIAQLIDDCNLKDGIPRLRKAIDKRRPPQAEFYFELANAYSKTDRPKEALPYYQEALRRKPDFPDARRGYGAALLRIGDVDAALKEFKTVAGAHPQDPAAFNALGEAYLHEGKLDAAVSTLVRALRIDEDLPEVYVNLAAALSRHGERPRAIEALRNAIRIRPDFAIAHNNLGSEYDAQGEFAQSQYHFRWAIRVDSTYPEPHYNYGRALAVRKMYAEAEAELNKALELDPRFAEAATSLGIVLERLGQPAKAIESYRRAIHLKPDLVVARFNLALALARSGDRVGAKHEFEAVVRSDPGDYQAHFHLGNILLAEGDRESARVHLRKAAESPQPALRTAAFDALRQIAAKSGTSGKN